jgi:hypothetical protein
LLPVIGILVQVPSNGSDFLKAEFDSLHNILSGVTGKEQTSTVAN